MRMLTSWTGRSRRAAATYALALLAAPTVVVAQAAPAAAATVTSFTWSSDYNHCVFGGTSGTVSPSSATFGLTTWASGIRASAGQWDLQLEAPPAGMLLPGRFVDDDYAGENMAWSAELGVDWQQGYGTFVVHSITRDDAGLVTGIDVSFEHACNDYGAMARGRLRINAPADATVDLVSTTPSTVAGQPARLVAGAAPGASVAFWDGTRSLGSATADRDGFARLATPSLATGTHSLTATAGGARSPAVAHVVRPGDTSLWVEGAGWDWPTQGRTYSFGLDNASFYPDSSSAAYVSVLFYGVSWFDVGFATVAGGTFLPGGHHLQAQRWGFADPGHPGLDVGGNERGCNMLEGRFTVARHTRRTDGSLGQFDAAFVQECDGNENPSWGRLRVRTSTWSALALDAAPQAGNKVALTARVSTATGAAPSGKVAFLVDDVSKVVVPIDATGAARTTLSLNPGEHTVLAMTRDLVGFGPSQHAARVTTLGTASTVSLSGQSGKGRVGRRELLTATVGGAAYDEGWVIFSVDGVATGLSPVVDGVAQVQWIPATSGNHTITARFSGDPLHAPATAPSFTRPVG